jgi:tripeptide aminopeptidase
MENSQLERLKEVLSVPTKTYKEENMVEYLRNILKTMPDVEYYTDEMNNVYATKGKLEDGEFYPMFIAHTDTVHELVDKIVVREEILVKPTTFGHKYDNKEFLSLKGYTSNGKPTGIGGDDKCGVFIALELLRILPKLKIGLFVSEETGCHGSSRCDLNFLSDVGYAIQFDAPGNNLITKICSGTALYEENGEFINIVKPLFEKTMGVIADEQSHPYTDVSQIKRKGDFSCINLSCGYYNMHSSNEFVVVSDVDKAINFAVEAVSQLGLKKYKYIYQVPSLPKYGEMFKIDTYDDEDDFDYPSEENEEVIDLETMKVYTCKIGITVELKFSGDYISLDKEEMLDLYSIIREQIMKPYSY